MAMALLRRTEGSGTSAILRASAHAASINRSCATTSFTMPMRKASWASKLVARERPPVGDLPAAERGQEVARAEMCRTSG